MDAIREVLSLLDRNSEALPEGEYLNACNKLKDIYNRMENMGQKKLRTLLHETLGS